MNNQIVLLADSGSTKTDWVLLKEQQVLLQFKTDGINPFFQSETEIVVRIESQLLPYLQSFQTIDTLYFYGAGCAFPEKNELVERALQSCFPIEVKVESDLLAAARSLCGSDAGIACILGTGSNSCQYDGKKIIRQVSPLGYVLGDEGSGAVLGKLLLGNLLKHQLPKSLEDSFFQEYALTPAMILEKVYKQPFPNRFLASFSPFLKRYQQESAIQDLLYKSFHSFFVRNVMQYDYQHQPVHLVGSIAWHYQEVIRMAADELGIRVERILQRPMDGLITYHGCINK